MQKYLILVVLFVLCLLTAGCGQAATTAPPAAAAPPAGHTEGGPLVPGGWPEDQCLLPPPPPPAPEVIPTPVPEPTKSFLQERVDNTLFWLAVAGDGTSAWWHWGVDPLASGVLQLKKELLNEK